MVFIIFVLSTAQFEINIEQHNVPKVSALISDELCGRPLAVGTILFMKKEIWKPITGYEGIYEVSNQGRIKSLTRKTRTRIGFCLRKEKFLAFTTIKGGYLRITLKGIGLLVHRVVAKEFKPNPNHLPEVNHKNGIKTDNRADNLEWTTRLNNQRHAIKNGLWKPELVPVLQMSQDGAFIKKWDSMSHAARNTPNTTLALISRVCNGKRKSTGGFKWQYA